MVVAPLLIIPIHGEPLYVTNTQRPAVVAGYDVVYAQTLWFLKEEQLQ